MEDLETWGKIQRSADDPQILHPLFWPNREYREGMDILVAGCGANQAAIYAFHNPSANVVGIDISGPSLQHEEFLKKKHNLENLSLHKIAIEEVEKLDQDFDLIATTGVLHHLENPIKGAKALKKLLKLEGVMHIMLYAKYARTGVYMMQEVFQILGLEQTKEEVALVRSSLEILPPDHFAKTFMKVASDLNADTSYIDTFLHRRDKAYSVGDVLDFVESSGLVFQSWIDNGFYYPDGLISSENPLYKRIMEKEKTDIWRITELLTGQAFLHSFVVCRTDRPQSSYLIDFNGDDFFDYIPSKWITSHTPPNAETKTPASIGRSPIMNVPLNDYQIPFFNQIDGKKTIRQCIEQSGLAGEPDQLERFARNFISSLWRLGFLFVRIP